jgi:hypothetical protein
VNVADIVIVKWQRRSKPRPDTYRAEAHRARTAKGSSSETKDAMLFVDFLSAGNRLPTIRRRI